jgi:hypothetical protein
MDRTEWLKVVYEAACKVAERHGPGLRKAVEARDDDGRLSREVAEVASEVIAGEGEIWDFIRHSRHPEPASEDWRRTATFEGAVVRAAVSALSADINDVLGSLSTGRMPTIEEMKSAEPRGPAES